MSTLNNNLLLGADAAAGGYQISRSLRFNSADSAYLSRTPASAGNRKTWTWAGWVKRSALGGTQRFFIAGVAGAGGGIQFEGDTLFAFDFPGFLIWGVQTTQVFRDLSAWYHIVLAIDTTQSTSSNRVKIYVNGIQVTTFSSSAYPSLNYDTYVNSASTIHAISSLNGGQDFYSGYLADVHFIDGQALDPTSFGEFDTNGIWQPKRYSGTYGTNGFKLDFADNSGNTATTLGKDTSGNGNNWTLNNLGVTAGAGNDSLVDSPTNYGTDTGVGGEVRGNYCTLNPIRVASGLTLSNGNLDVAHGAASSSADNAAVGTISVSSGKWYWEVLVTSLAAANIGIILANERLSTAYLGSTAGSYSWFSSTTNSQKYNNGVGVSYGARYQVNDIVGVALDLDNGTLTYYKNGVSQGTAFTSTSGTFAPASSGSVGSTASLVYNFGQRPFAYTAPSGFKALCTANLPAPVVTKPSTAFDVKLYTGNGITQMISGLGFSPDLVWIKERSSTAWNALFDTIRGANKALYSNDNFQEETLNNTFQSFNSDGFSLSYNSAYSSVFTNRSSQTYAAWAWDAGSSTVTNTAGSITSSVRANASAGFSVVTATVAGGLNSPTIGHGLGVKPGLIIAKSRNEALNWYTWHSSFGANEYISLNTTGAKATSSFSYGTINSSIFTIGGTNTSTVWVSGASGNYVFYCFAPVAGYSAFGSYTGNGSADGPFVYTGFRPRWILFKRTDTASNWTIIDAAREGYNVDNDPLFPNLVDAEGTADLADILSNGFKLRSTDASVNANTGTYIYACFAESPLSLARAR